MVQLAPELSGALQLLVSAKSPPALIPMMESWPWPPLITWTVSGPLVEPTAVFGKFSNVLERSITGRLVPAPLSAMVCGLPVALSAMESEADRAPVAAGSKVKVTVHFAPDASDAPQLP